MSPDAPPAESRDLRICFAIETLQIGGAETHAVALAEHLVNRGWTVGFAVMREAGPLAERCEKAGIRVQEHLMKSRRGLEVVRRFERLADSWRFGVLFVVECFYINALLAYRAARSVLGCRAATIIHNMPSSREFSNPAIFRLRVGLMESLFDRVVFVAERQRRHYDEKLGVRFPRSVVIPNGVDVERFAPAPLPVEAPEGDGRRYRVGIVGSFQPRKGHEFFLRAAARVREHRSDVEFLIIGDGPRRPELEQAAHNLGLGRTVHFLGNREDVPDLLRTLDLVVLSSHEPEGGHAETLPLVLLEAGATGLPVVATDVGAVSDLVVEGETGFVVAQRDYAGIAHRIERLLNEPELRRSMGVNARARILEQFNAAPMYRRFEDLFLTGNIKE